MNKAPKRFLRGEIFRYLVFGVLTVVVNVFSYRILAEKLDTVWANTLAFFIAVLFAYWTNCRFVFRVPCTKQNFLQFMTMRIGTLLIDDGGMLLLIGWGWPDLLAKCAVNALIIVLNYLFSKLLVFKKDSREKEKRE